MYVLCKVHPFIGWKWQSTAHWRKSGVCDIYLHRIAERILQLGLKSDFSPETPILKPWRWSSYTSAPINNHKTWPFTDKMVDWSDALKISKLLQMSPNGKDVPPAIENVLLKKCNLFLFPLSQFLLRTFIYCSTFLDRTMNFVCFIRHCI